MDENMNNWEENLSVELHHLMVQDDETGEYWHPQPENEEKEREQSDVQKNAETKTKTCTILLKCNALKSALSHWRIPKEYSKLGCNSSLVRADVHSELGVLKYAFS